MDNLHHQLLGLDGVYHILAEGFLLHSVGEALGHLVVYVGIKERAAHILEGFGHIDFGNLTLAFKYFETSFKFLAKILKHMSGMFFPLKLVRGDGWRLCRGRQSRA